MSKHTTKKATIISRERKAEKSRVGGAMEVDKYKRETIVDVHVVETTQDT